MKKANRICIFLYGLFCCLTMVFLTREIYRDHTEEPSATQEESPQVAVPSNTTKQYKYVVVEEANTLTVYYVKDHIKYLSTDISVSNLPQDLQEKVAEGLQFIDEKSLYDFLENYSS